MQTQTNDSRKINGSIDISKAGVKTGAISVLFEYQQDDSVSYRFEARPHTRFQVVFCRENQKIPKLGHSPDFWKYFIYKPAELLKVFGPVRRAWGWLGLFKTVLKLITKKRKLYLFVRKSNSTVVAYGWVNVGFCQHYEISGRDIVVGPIWTASNSRGCGLATEGLKLTVCEMHRRGFQRFYIDTRENNIPAIRAILNTGFEPVAAQFRGFDE